MSAPGTRYSRPYRLPSQHSSDSGIEFDADRFGDWFTGGLDRGFASHNRRERAFVIQKLVWSSREVPIE
ncbi:hypothetical protein C481_06302 [Natrialba asiatica DSM 12278]|uniref:Uncharacterized protein n=1 Tax=Natrialba asiatica (strain ATCC 700177 / DSM 12278 / JCM 9576 / FERM P-10747 / NBRC 102637 / 172P1) TaxID=29540 RepID=M0AXT6_NATA1|nr:hypothetical protein C481_06302 [Natrialba asiatica DSM 12278]